MFVQLTGISSILASYAIVERVWTYLTRQFTFGRITVSVSSVIIGALVVLLTILIARWSSVLIERRLSNRRHIDPGLRYTICRLAKYAVITVGLLVGLQQGFWIGLPLLAL